MIIASGHALQKRLEVDRRRTLTKRRFQNFTVFGFGAAPILCSPYLERSHQIFVEISDQQLSHAINDSTARPATPRASGDTVKGPCPGLPRALMLFESSQCDDVIRSSAFIASSDSSRSDAARFSRRCSTLDVPGMSRMFGERRSSHASATCIGVDPS